MSRNQVYLFFAIISVLASNTLFGMHKSRKIFQKKNFPILFKHNKIDKQLFFNAWANQQKRSLFHYTEYAGLDPFKCEKLREIASPLKGIALVESTLVRNLYEYGPEENTAVELINNNKYGFFHLLVNDLRHTQINLAYGLTPELTARIVAESIEERLEVPEVRAKIVTTWREEYKQARPGAKVTKKAVEDQYDMLVKVNKEGFGEKDQLLFPKNFGISLMLAYLYRKGTKQDLLRYLNALAYYFPEKMYAQDTLSLNQESYTYEELEEYLNYFYNGNFRIFFSDLTKAVAAYIYDMSKRNAYPPLVLQNSYGYQSEQERPDCCEAALRNFFNLLLTSPDKKEFNLSILPNIIKPHKKFIEFYTQFSGYQEVNNKKVGQAWMNLVSGHKNVHYKQKNYEIIPSLENILRVMNILLQTEATSFEELGTLLSTETRSVLLSPSGDDLKIDIIDANKNAYKMILEINPGRHAATKINFRKENHSILSQDNFMDTLTAAASKYSAKHLLPLFSTKLDMQYFLYRRKAWHGQCHHTALSDLERHQRLDDLNGIGMGIYSLELADVNERSYALEVLCKEYNAKKDPYIKSVIKTLCKKMPHDDGHIMKKVFYNVIPINSLRKESWFSDVAIASPEGFIKTLWNVDIHSIDDHFLEIFEKILNKEGSTAYQWGNRNIPRIIREKNLLNDERFRKHFIKNPYGLTYGIRKIQNKKEFSSELEKLIIDCCTALTNMAQDNEKHFEDNDRSLFHAISESSSILSTSEKVLNALTNYLETITLSKDNAMGLADVITRNKLYKHSGFKKLLIENPYGCLQIIHSNDSDFKKQYLNIAIDNAYIYFLNTKTYCDGKYEKLYNFWSWGLHSIKIPLKNHIFHVLCRGKISLAYKLIMIKILGKKTGIR